MDAICEQARQRDGFGSCTREGLLRAFQMYPGCHLGSSGSVVVVVVVVKGIWWA
jgi:hypothetical protein